MLGQPPVGMAQLPPVASAADRDPAFELCPRYLTPQTQPLGGTLKERPEDFLVDEIPLYQPAGEGEHIYLLVEKRELTTAHVVQTLARHFGVKRRDIGVAGMKDKQAITRQVISIHTPGKTFEDFPMLEDGKITVLWADMHTNKLRTGHLRGNRFSIKVRGVDMTGVRIAKDVLDQLERSGVPNYAGPQRFGNRQDNHILGRLMLTRRFDALIDWLLGPDEVMSELNPDARALYHEGDHQRALEAYPFACRTERCALVALRSGATMQEVFIAIDKNLRRIWMSAFQSAIFNRFLAQRLEDGTFDRLVEGDVAYKHANGALFTVDQAVREDSDTPRRLHDFEISPSGPIWGAQMMQATGDPGELEQGLLRQTGVDEDALARARELTGSDMPGERRALRVPLIDPEVEGGMDEHGQYVRCAFELPKGAFATVVMREIIKSGAARGASVEAAD